MSGMKLEFIVRTGIETCIPEGTFLWRIEDGFMIFFDNKMKELKRVDMFVDLDAVSLLEKCVRTTRDKGFI